MAKIYRALGLMSGTSIDGIDVALIETDGRSHIRSLGTAEYKYDEPFRHRMQSCFGNRLGTADPAVAAMEMETTLRHAQAVKAFMAQKGLTPSEIDLIGFHGQTIWHNPAERKTIQLGDGALLAAETGIDVVNDFRTADVLAGGQGAPLVPLYHRALATDLPKPAAILNIGGVSNLTWIGGAPDEQILAFDTGPGNALIDDWVRSHTGQPFDRDGLLARAGQADMGYVSDFLKHPYFVVKPPKSLDRDAFARWARPEHLSLEDGAATLTVMAVKAICAGLEYMPEKTRVIYLTGGGRHNRTLAAWLGDFSGAKVGSVDDLGWSGDGLEAEAFAYLAVRSVENLPLSLPGTTGVPEPMRGGRFWPKKRT